jgi:hypothetical protein
MNRKLSLFLLFLGLCLLFQTAFSIGQFYQNTLNNERTIAGIETRVALDLSRLKIANAKFRTAADPSSIQDYLQQMNSTLRQINATALVVSLQGINVSDKISVNQIEQIVLKSPEQDVSIEVQLLPINWLGSLTLLAPFFAVLVAGLRYFSPSVKKLNHKLPDTISPEPDIQKLIINLKDKSIKFGIHGEAILLPNKPFCFYAALVDYCSQTDVPNLRHNNEVPNELLLIANKYFYRLIELGHTKRKRPDFSANLDKTLSEIRSALDETFKHNSEIKELFYPPKAQGEGSRSKTHNYALINKQPELVEFIGK